MKKKYLWLLVLILIAAGFYWLYQRYVLGPEFSLYQIKQAVDNRDMAALEKYVDVERTSASFLDQTMQAGMANLPEKDRAMAALFLGMAIASQKDQVLQALRAELERYVGQAETGQGPPAGMDPEDWEDVQALLPLQEILNKSQLSKSHISDISFVNIKDDQALVGLDLVVPSQPEPVLVEVQMIDRGGHWQVIGLPNAGEVLKKMGLLEIWRQMQTAPELRM